MTLTSHKAFMAALLTMVIAASAAFAQEAKVLSGEPKPAPGEEFVYAPLMPVHYFSRGWEYYRKGEFTSAALEMQKAASMLEIASKWSDGVAKSSLDKASIDLNTIASKLSQESEKVNLSDLRHAIAQAHTALAQFNLHHAQTGLSKLENREVNVAGHHLQAAAEHLRKAADWSGQKLGTGTEEVLRGIDEHGNKMITERDYEITKPDKVMADFSREIERFAQELETATPAKDQAR